MKVEMKKPEKLLEILKEIKLKEYQFIIEGIDIDIKKKLVSFNPTHEDNINTSVLLNPSYTKNNGIEIISIFKRKISPNNTYDGNPLIYALKNINNWKFKNPKSDITNLLKQFIRISEKINPIYDTIITIPSENELNTNFLHRLNKIIKANYQITDYLSKLSAEYVFDAFIDWNKLDKDYPDPAFSSYEKDINIAFDKMEKKNQGIFSFKYLEPKLRKYITKTMNDDDEKIIEYAPIINDKNILILDDTISSGTSISEACKNILNVFSPKSITVITLFSKL